MRSHFKKILKSHWSLKLRLWILDLAFFLTSSERWRKSLNLSSPQDQDQNNGSLDNAVSKIHLGSYNLFFRDQKTLIKKQNKKKILKKILLLPTSKSKFLWHIRLFKPNCPWEKYFHIIGRSLKNPPLKVSEFLKNQNAISDIHHYMIIWWKKG